MPMLRIGGKVLRPGGWPLAGYAQRRSLTVTGAVTTDYIVPLTVHRTTGTDTGNTIYLGSNARADFSDLRFTTKDNSLTFVPFAVLNVSGTTAKVALRVPADAEIERGFWIYWDKAATAAPFVIARVTDAHYDSGTTEHDRNQALTFIANFKTAMAALQPDVAILCGDMQGASSSNVATQTAWMEAVRDGFDGVDAGIQMMGVEMGNHDFEWMTLAQVRAELAEAWMEPGLMYGKLDLGPFLFVSLDSNYNPADDTHLSAAHQGFGYIDAAQLTWLTGVLAAATKPVIVGVHHIAAEVYANVYGLTNEIFHVQNRISLRAILEASGKVAVVTHGHMHAFRTDTINGIPYLVSLNLTNDDQPQAYGDTQASGKWSELWIYAQEQVIRFRHMGWIGGAAVCLHENYVPYRTSYSSDEPASETRTFAAASVPDGKDNIAQDSGEIYANASTYLFIRPVDLSVPEPSLSHRTLKLTGRTNTPDFGRGTFYFASQTAKFKAKLAVRLAQTNGYLSIKLNKDDTSQSGARIDFQTTGRLHVSDAGVSNDLQAYLANTWYEIEFRVDVATDTYTLYLDGVAIASGYDFVAARTALNQMEFVTQVGTYFIDYPRIEPWLSPEPVFA